MNEYVVEMRHITKRFPGIVANDDVTIQVRPGEVFALLGENGAGKSTMMSMLFGMYQPDEGEIVVKGETVRFRSSTDATNHGIGMVHQEFKLVNNFTVAENIVMGVEPMKKYLGFIPCIDMKEANKEISELSKRYGLEVNPTDLIEDLPVSTRQRVEILKMLYREADILIFDEPTAMLTPQEIDSLLEIIKELRASGKTIILITHKIEEVRQVADRCAVLRRGKLVGVYDVGSISAQELANLMVGRNVQLTTEKSSANFRQTVLEVEHLTVRNVDDVEVVKDVSFKIHGGEIFAIAGVSGNGQTEVADAIAGLMDTYSGTIKLCGTDITNMAVRDRVKCGMSYIPEDRQGVGLFLDFTLSQNLGLRRYYKEPLSKNGVINSKEFDKYADELIDKYDIRSGQGGRTVARMMSGGNQQKAIIAREVEEHTPLVIFVQPTRGLDIGAIENIHNNILKERDEGHAVLLVSLDLDEIMQLADTIGVIFGGQLLKIADASTMTSQDVGQYMMGVVEA